MGAVSALATVFAIVGWLVVVFVVFLVIGGGVITSRTFNSPQAGQIVAGILAPYVLVSLVPFLGWGLLQGLVEIHKELEAIRLLMARSVPGTPSGSSPSSEPEDASRETSTAAAQPIPPEI